MKNSRRIVSVFILLAFSIIDVGAQAQRQRSRLTDRQISAILQRLEQSSNRFRQNVQNFLEGNGRGTRPQNDINSFEPAFESAFDQFRDRFTRRLAVTGDVKNVLQKASLINGFMTRNRLNPEVQNDWTSVRTDLNALASAYGISWQWNQPTLPPINSSRSSRLPDSELNQLIRRIETGGDTFRSSLTDAFSRTRYDQTTGESNLNEAVSGFKNATVQLRYQFDTRQPVSDYVARVLARATSIDTYMRNNRLTTRAQNDWSTLRGDLNKLAGAFNILANWQNGPDQRRPQAGYPKHEHEAIRKAYQATRTSPASTPVDDQTGRRPKQMVHGGALVGR